MAEEYTEANFKVLRGCEHVRLRPAMYIGDTGPSGLFYMVMEAVTEALDRFPHPSAGQIEVALSETEGVCLRDSGIPIPLARLPHLGVEVQASFAAAIISALSTRLDIDVHADGVQWRQSFSRGAPIGDIVRVGPTTHSGNTFIFRPDPEIFTQTTTVPVEPICQRLHELAAFYPGLRFTLNGETIHHPDGLPGLFAIETAGLDSVHGAPISGTIETEEGRAQLMFWWYDGRSRVVSFANGYRTLGGEHHRGFLTALTRVLGARPNLRTAQTARRVPMADMVRAGLVAVIAVELADPFYNAPTKENLTNMEAFRLLDALTVRLLDEESMELHAVEAHLLAANPDPKSRNP